MNTSPRARDMSDDPLTPAEQQAVDNYMARHPDADRDAVEQAIRRKRNPEPIRKPQRYRNQSPPSRGLHGPAGDVSPPSGP